MLGDFLTRCLVLLLGYAYPAFECFKSVEKNKIEIDELRFWCQYWIIVAALTVCERISDIFISWLPMYGEAKLAFIVYLWYPKTKGTRYIYESLLRPYVAKHETDIDRKLQELKARAWDFAMYYWQHCAKTGQTTFFQVLQYLASQSGKFTNTGSEEKSKDHAPTTSAAPPSEMPSMSKLAKSKGAPKSPSAHYSTINRSVTDSPKSIRVQAHLDQNNETAGAGDTEAADANDKLQQIRMRLRRSKPSD